MGDRANVYVVEEKPDSTGHVQGVYLHTHWRGHEWPDALRQALDTPWARGRWEDFSYLIRILILEMFEDLRGQETGGGVSRFRDDNSYPITILDLRNQQVAWAPEREEGNASRWYGHMPLEQFCAQERADYPQE